MPVFEGLTVLLVCAVLAPIGCRLLWMNFGSSFVGGFAPKEFSDGVGQVCVFVNYLGVALEGFAVVVWCGVPYVFGEDIFNESDLSVLFYTFPERLEKALDAVETGRAFPGMIHVGLYVGSLFLFVLSYYRAGDVTSDALFTIDRQKNEEICDKCSRLVHTHTQHCAYCWRCVDRFDHHSFFVNNCVAERNGKHYTLALVYNEVRCTLAASVVLYRLFLHTSALSLLVLGAAMLWISVSFLSVGFLLLMWTIAIAHGFNSSTESGRNTQDGASSVVVLDETVRLLSTKMVPSYSEWIKAMKLPVLSAKQKERNIAAVMGESSRWQWWWPSSPYNFPDYGQHAFVFKRG